MDVEHPAQVASQAPNVMLKKIPYHTNEIVKPRSELGPIQEIPQVRRPMVIPPFDPNEVSEQPIRPIFAKWQIPSHQHAALDKYIKGKFENSDIVPPRNTPFHEALGNYVQRWAVWISEIEDRERRDHLLVWVMEKMENTWRYGIDHGLYPRMGDPQLDEDGQLREPGAPTSLREKPLKRSKKSDNTLILEDEIVPRQIENARAPLRITREDFIAAGGSIDSLNTRIALRDVQGGEALFQAEANRLGRKFQTEDWWGRRDDTNIFKGMLWLYCLHEVQVAKEEVEKLRRIMKNMTAPNQKKNTNRRIADEMNRINHWLAMALELHPKWVEVKRINTDDEDEEDGSEAEDPRKEQSTHNTPNPCSILGNQADSEMVDQSLREELAEASKPAATAELPHDALGRLVVTANQAPVIDPSYSASQQDITVPATTPLSILVANLDTTKCRKGGGQAIDETAVKTTLTNPQVETGPLDVMDVDPQRSQQLTGNTPQSKQSTLDGIPRVAQHPVVLKLTNSKKNKQPIKAERRKRKAESDEDWKDEEKVMNIKKRKADNGLEQQIQTTKQDKTPLTPPRTKAASPSVASSTGAQAKQKLPNLSEEDKAKRHSYLLKIFIPKINQMLRGSRLGHLRIVPREWDVVRDKLAAASVPVETRNHLMRDFYSGFRTEQRGDTSGQTPATRAKENDAGRRESTPPANRELQTASAGQRTALPTPSKVVTLKTFLNFDPAVYSPNNVGKISGFRYRFTAGSSLRDRRACQAFIMKYVFEGIGKRTHGMHQPFYAEREAGQLHLIGEGYWDEIDGSVAQDGHWLLGSGDGLASDHGTQTQGGDPTELEEEHINEGDPLSLLD